MGVKLGFSLKGKNIDRVLRRIFGRARGSNSRMVKIA
jgi:hypothetical protein